MKLTIECEDVEMAKLVLGCIRSHLFDSPTSHQRRVIENVSAQIKAQIKSHEEQTK